MKIIFTAVWLLAIPPCLAQTRSSSSYTVVSEVVDTGGLRSVSTSYTSFGSVGKVTGVSTGAALGVVAKQGFLGQIYELTSLQLVANPATVNEMATLQLGAAQVLDDLTTLAVSSAGVTWSIQNGPLAIDVNGLATAGAVSQNTPATVQGTFAGTIGTIDLSVLDTVPDNSGTYAHDGLADNWQVQYFGANNPDAAPSLDPDFDGVSNLVEFATSGNPVAPGVVAIVGVKNGNVFEFTYPRATSALAHGVGFTVEWTASLAAPSWTDVGVSEKIVSGDGPTQQVKASVPAGTHSFLFVRLKVKTL